MSETEEPVAPAAPQRRLGFVFLALVVLAVILGVRWWYVTSSALGQVFVEASAPACTDTKIADATVEGASVAAPEVVRGMRCEVIVDIVNPGTVAVTLSRVTAPGLGPDSGLPVQATDAEDRSPTAANGDEDAAYTIDQRLEGGDFIEVTIAYEYREGGCLDTATYSAEDWPAAQVTMSRRTKTVTAERLFALTATDDSTC